ncbi:hypothetical protein LJC34_07865, partial [Oscillospiraceae bacterium OttesenSCG-928-G22]|nr:hypothetical protein [Oscillospiraceae bacterium OttesenSCG-928-G22]
MKSNKLLHIVILLFFVIPVFFFGIYSIFDTDLTISEAEKRALKARPDFSADALFAGDFTREFDEYYSDTFPFRELLISWNRQLNKLYYF